MAQRYYQQGNTGVYVLELEGNLTRSDKDSLESLTKTLGELSKKEGLKELIIYQPNENLKIDPIGVGQLIGLCTTLSKGTSGIKTSFVGLKGAFKTLFERCKFERAFKTYYTLEEALGSS